jgi:hypothetical protein
MMVMKLRKGASWFGLIGMVAAACLATVPMSLAQNASVSLSRNFRPDPIKLSGSTGGNVSLASLAGIEANCRGFAQSQPSHVITLNESFPMLDLLAYTTSINNDPTMLIKGPNGIVVCANDESGINPQVSRRMPQGTYQVWIGSKEANQSFSYTLSLSEIRQR